MQIEARVFEEMRYEIKDLKIRVDGQTRPYQEATTKKTMTLKDKFALAFKGEPEKTFIKAGVMGIDGTLTAEGRELWTTWLVKKFGDDFKKEVVDPILAETAADKKD